MPHIVVSAGALFLEAGPLSLPLGPASSLGALGWMLFLLGAASASRELRRGIVAGVPPVVSAASTLAAMSAGLGLLTQDALPTVSRWFFLPYALLASVAALVGFLAAQRRATSTPAD